MKTFASGSPASTVWVARACFLAGLFQLSFNPPVQVRKLNPPLARQSAGAVLESAVTPDGSQVVYVADQEGDGDGEILGVPMDASRPPMVLSGTLEAGEVIYTSGILISADGTRAVYHAGYDEHELYSALIDGGDGSQGPVKLNGPLVANGDVPFDLKGIPARISPDSSRVVYVADQDTDEVFELYSVPIGAGAPVKLNGPFATGWDVDIQENRGFLISPDGARVVFLARGYDYGDLYSVPIDGSQPAVRITQGPSNYNRIYGWSIAPDGASVVYRHVLPSVAALELYRVPIDGSQPPVRLHPPFLAGQNVVHHEISPDGARVVYAADVTRDGVEYNDPVELFSVPIDASLPPVKLNPPIVPNGSLADGDPFDISPDSSRVVYLADQDTYAVFELYSVLIDGGDGSQGAVKLSGPLVTDGDVGNLAGFPSFAIGSDGTHVVYLADQDTDEKRELYGTAIDGSASPVKLSSSLSSLGPFFVLTPEGSDCVFIGDEDVYTVWELFRVPVDGSTGPVQLSAPLPSGGDVRYEANYVNVQVTAAGRVVYSATQDEPGLAELYSVPLAGGGASTKLNAPFPRGAVIGRVYSAQISPDGRRAIYRAYQEKALELFSVPTGDPPAPAIRLNAPFTDEDQGVTLASIDPTGRRVVFVQSKLSTTLPSVRHTLQSVPIDGSAAPVQLSLGDDTVNLFEFSADGGRVAFLADTDPTLLGTRIELFAAPIHGGQPAVRLNAPLAGTMPFSTASFEITADATRVVYLAEQDATGVIELYGMPIDASQPPVKLSGTLVGGGDVQAFALAPDSTRVVFRADRDANDVFELYTSLIDGSQPPVELSGALVAGGDVLAGFALAADGSRAVFLADKHVDDVIELFSVPIDASQPPLELNPSFDGYSFRDVFSFRLAGDRAVYRANQDQVMQIELYSVPIDGNGGGASAVKISGPEFSNSVDFSVSADGRRVVYLSDVLEPGVTQLYSAPADASRPPVQLNGPLPAGGDVQTGFAISADGREVVYRADQDRNEVFELYRVRIDGRGPPSKVSGALVTNGDVLDFSASRRADRIVYRADQDSDSIDELYLSLQARAVDRSPAPTESVSR